MILKPISSRLQVLDHNNIIMLVEMLYYCFSSFKVSEPIYYFILGIILWILVKVRSIYNRWQDKSKSDSKFMLSIWIFIFYVAVAVWSCYKFKLVAVLMFIHLYTESFE